MTRLADRRPKTRLGLLAACLAGVTLVAGCGSSHSSTAPAASTSTTAGSSSASRSSSGSSGSSSSGSGSATVNAAALCSSITPAEVSTLSGMAVDTPEPSGTAGTLATPQCSFRLHGTPGNDVTLGLDPTNTIDSVKRVFPGGTDVPGLGSAAYFTTGAVGAADLYVVTSGGLLMVQAANIVDPNFSVAAHQAGNIAIARKVIPALGLH